MAQWRKEGKDEVYTTEEIRYHLVSLVSFCNGGSTSMVQNEYVNTHSRFSPQEN